MHFGVKLAWFVLSVTGFFTCTVVLTAFSRTTGINWGPMLYCVGNFLLQGSFCLGMIYRMDPYLMPRSFCIAQTVLISLGAFIIGGVAMAFTVASYLTSTKPKTWGDSYIRLMPWKPIYWVFIAALPFCASAAHLIVILKFDSAQPSDDMHCDSSDPEWVRFLGYAGIPLIIAWPCLLISVKTVLRIRETNMHIQRARPESGAQTLDNLVLRKSNSDYPTPSSRGLATVGHRTPSRRESGSSSIVRPSSGAQASFQVTMPSFPSPTSTDDDSPLNTAVLLGKEHRASEVEMDDAASSKVSLSFPTFSNPNSSSYALATEGNADVLNPKTLASEEVKEARESESECDHAWNEDKQDIKSIAESMPEDDITDDRYIRHASVLPIRAKSRRPIPILKPALWQIILFQIAFMVVQTLACISTIIDVATSRPTPTPMGTQHFALLLAGWGPVVVFGHLPVVRRNLRFWRPVVT